MPILPARDIHPAVKAAAAVRADNTVEAAVEDGPDDFKAKNPRCLFASLLRLLRDEMFREEREQRSVINADYQKQQKHVGHSIEQIFTSL